MIEDMRFLSYVAALKVHIKRSIMMIDYKVVRRFRTKNFEVVCEEGDPSFVDHLEHGWPLKEAVERGEATVTHIRAYVYYRGTKVGEVTVLGNVYISEAVESDPATPEPYDRTITMHGEYRRDAIRGAIQSARKELQDLVF